MPTENTEDTEMKREKQIGRTGWTCGTGRTIKRKTIISVWYVCSVGMWAFGGKNA